MSTFQAGFNLLRIFNLQELANHLIKLYFVKIIKYYLSIFDTHLLPIYFAKEGYLC